MLLEVEGLKAHYSLQGGRSWVRAVDDVSFKLDRGETLGIVGESGCGKSSLAFSLMRLLPKNAKILGGKVILDGTDILQLESEDLRHIRSKRISMIFQSAMNALDPVYRVGDLLSQILRAHNPVSKSESETRIRELFSMVGLPPSSIHSYPHELSGGMKQRVVIAMSLLCSPDIVIADEPVTALDVVVQDQILEEMEELQKRFNLSMILISHDISVVSETCSNIAVMYAGKIVESAKTELIFGAPRHPYTVALFGSVPAMKGRRKRLSSLPGSPPDLSQLTTGCAFQPRCPIAGDLCKNSPPATSIDNHISHCHFADSDRIVQLREKYSVNE